jgi:signal transduction histidine kinase
MPSRTSKLENLGLASAAGGFCRELSDRLGMKIAFHSESIPRDLPGEISLCFRVLQEALQNAIKHSGSRHFQVSLCGGSSGVELTVRDSALALILKTPQEGMGSVL